MQLLSFPSGFLPLFALADLGWESFIYLLGPLMLSVILCIVSSIVRIWSQHAAKACNILAGIFLLIECYVIASLFF